MHEPHRILMLTTLLGALGMWLMLPRGTARGRGVGVVLAVAALGLGMSQVPRLGDWIADAVFLVLAGVTVVSAAATITFRNPVYCAIWFGQTLLGTAGLFLFTGAQFLAVATVVVYAGAILVTFLFVLMLAQPEGRAAYDRVSWEALISAVTGVVIVGILSMTIGGVFLPANSLSKKGTGSELTSENPAKDIGREVPVPFLQRAARATEQPLPSPTAEELAANVLTPEHVARLGGELFGRHLIAIEVAGTLLLVALVGAAVIVAQAKEEKP